MKIKRILNKASRGLVGLATALMGTGRGNNVVDGDCEEGPLSYEAANALFNKMVKAKELRRPHYAWGSLQALNLAKALDIRRVSFIEFGVAGGNGLTALESIAETLERVFAVDVDIYGFDAVGGMPAVTDYRDTPNLWRQGFYPMDQEKLQQRLKRTQLYLGLIEHTIPKFLAKKPAPVAFIAFDLCYYSSTAKAFSIFDADQSVLLPRVHCFFRNTLGRSFGDFNGERLAISEFNTTHQTRNISKIYGLQYYVGSNVGRWVDQYYMVHIGDHELYGRYDGLIQEAALDLPK
jgi:hypothetical protein